MFDREAVVEALGRFDHVRKAADTEFIERMRQVFGRSSIRELDLPLGLYQLTEGSLSRQDFRIGWHRFARTAYRAAYSSWHRQINAGLASAKLDPEDDPFTATRPFAAPLDFTDESYDAIHADVHIVADLRPATPGSARILREITVLAEAGHRVVVTPVEVLSRASVPRERPLAELWDLANRGTVTVIPREAPVHSRLMLVRSPEVFMWRPEGWSSRPRRVVVTVDEPVFDPLGGHAIFDPHEVAATIRDAFGLDPVWWPHNEDVRGALAHTGITHVEPARTTSVALPSKRPGREIVDRPVIGFVSSHVGVLRSAPIESSVEALTAAGYDVRILGKTRRRHRALEFSAGLLSAEEFFDQVDVFVAPRSPQWGGTLDWAILTALSRGCLVLADPIYRGSFGNHVQWLDGRPLADIIGDWERSPTTVARLRQTGSRWCSDVASPVAYVDVVTSFMPERQM